MAFYIPVVDEKFCDECGGPICPDCGICELGCTCDEDEDLDEDDED